MARDCLQYWRDIVNYIVPILGCQHFQNISHYWPILAIQYWRIIVHPIFANIVPPILRRICLFTTQIVAIFFFELRVSRQDNIKKLLTLNFIITNNKKFSFIFFHKDFGITEGKKNSHTK